MLGTDDDDDCLLGGGYQLEMQNFSKGQTNPTSPSYKIPWAWHKDGSQPLYESGALNVGLARRPIEYIFGLGAGPVGLKRACLNTAVRSKYHHQDFATMSWGTIPDLVVNFES